MTMLANLLAFSLLHTSYQYWIGPFLLHKNIQAAMAALNYTAVREDLTHLMTDSQPWWPADYGHYGPLMIRLAWHSSGSYRTSDGRGGGDGGRLRFDPERSWDDNTNLDKALKLLWPIKMKYGVGLSWGDLIILAGNTALESMGLPLLGFCGGRVDDYDGSDSTLLGPNPEQEVLFPCKEQGECEAPLGSIQVGLIYVNPEGRQATGNATASAISIREVFNRMNMNDSETVALIGGGHAFGKGHGACPLGPGKKPFEAPAAAWEGECGSGMGEDTYTSGLEMPWTSRPTSWTNDYFINLKSFDWQEFKGPGNKIQWKVAGEDSPKAPSAGGTGLQDIGMFTSDVALLKDPIYLQLVNAFAADEDSLSYAFKHAWYKLTSRDMGPATRCLGPLVPPPQPWQSPLPPTPSSLPDFTVVQQKMEAAMDKDPSLASQWLRLGWRCAATYRQTDYLGGCNGARIRLSPQSSWPVNSGLSPALAALGKIKEEFEAFGALRSVQYGCSWADCIVLAATTALKRLGVNTRPFCGGRTDAESDSGASDFLQPRLSFTHADSAAQLKEVARLMGLTQREFAVLNAAGYAAGQGDCTGLFCQRSGTSPATQLDNTFFTVLLSHRWLEAGSPSQDLYRAEAEGAQLYLLPSDLLYSTDGELRAIAEDYQQDNSQFLEDVAAAWNKLVTADRFDGPLGNVCR